MSSSTSRTDEPTVMAIMPPTYTSNAEQFEDAEYDVAFGFQQAQQAEQAPQSNGQFDDVEDDDHFDFWPLQLGEQPRQQQIPADDAMAQRNDFDPYSGGTNGAAALPMTNGASDDDANSNHNSDMDDDTSNRGTDESSDTEASSDDAMEAVEPVLVAAGVRTTRYSLRPRVLPPPGSQENPLVLEDSFSEASLESEDVSMEDDHPNDENELPPELNPECWKYKDFPYHIPGGVEWPEGCYWYQPNSGWPVVKFYSRHKMFYCQKHVTAWWTKLPKNLRAQIAAGATKLKHQSFATMYIEPSKIMESKKRR